MYYHTWALFVCPERDAFYTAARFQESGCLLKNPLKDWHKKNVPIFSTIKERQISEY